MASDLTVAFLLFPQVTQLDLTGPAQVLSRLGSVRIELVAQHLEPVPTDSGFSILPTATFRDVQSADILCIPGGVGTGAVLQDADTLAWIRAVAADATWITSVCSGSLILAAAGLLEGRKATGHWTSREQLKWFGAIPIAERVVFDGNRVTGAGVTAGIYFALALTAKIRGDEHAKLVQLSLEYDPAPPFDSGSPENAESIILERFEAIAGKDLADRAMSVRAIASRGHDV